MKVICAVLALIALFCAAAAGKVTQASAPVHRGAISIDRSTVTIHGQTAVNGNPYSLHVRRRGYSLLYIRYFL